MKKKRLLVSILLLSLFLGSFPLVSSQTWENQYGRLEVTPDTAYSPTGLFQQYYDVTWYYPDNTIDIAFGFNHSLPYGKVFYFNGEEYRQVSNSHIEYNNNHYYVFEDINVKQDETISGYWEYRTAYQTGKWDLYAKLSSDTWQEAFTSGRIIHLDPWWNGQWSNKKRITFDHDQVPSTQTDFPVLVNITDADLANDAQSDGDDICFLDSTETTQLDHDIEYFNSATGELVVWIEIPTLDSSSDTQIYMYYNNSGCSNQEDEAGTFSSTYESVWHCNDSTGSLTDVVNHNNGTGNGDLPTANTSGRIASCQYFDGDGDIFNFGDVCDVGTDDFSLQCWIMTDESDDSEVYPFAKAGSDPRWYWAYGDAYNDYLFCADDGNSIHNIKQDADLNPSSWTFLVVTVDRDDYGTMYIDGVEISSYKERTSFSACATLDNAHDLLCGGYDNANPSPIMWIDEMRISIGTELSADWILIEYNNIVNATDGGFFTMGTADGNDPPTITNPAPVNNSIDQSTAFTWNCTIEDDRCGLNWTIECTNGQSASGNNETNGTKSLSLSGLSYSTEYMIYVNATENITGGKTTRKTYNFTTEEVKVYNLTEDDFTRIQQMIEDYDALKEDDILTPEIIFMIIVFFIWYLIHKISRTYFMLPAMLGMIPLMMTLWARELLTDLSTSFDGFFVFLILSIVMWIYGWYKLYKGMK